MRVLDAVRQAGCGLLLGAGLLAGAADIAPAQAQGLQLAPYKNKLFQYPGVLETRDNGDYVVVDYDKMRDIHKRDEIPERKVQWQYVSTGTRQAHYDFKANGRAFRYVGVGAVNKPASMIVIYLHGQNGTRFQGADDWMFGGNFNRIKNLTVTAGGVYLSPDFTDFDTRGTEDIKALMMAFAGKSPGAPIFVACGSYGGKLCWSLLQDKQAASVMSGVLLLGSNNDPAFFNTGAMQPGGRQIPLYFGQGSDDNVFGWKDQAAFYDKIRAKIPGYPVRFVLFQTGSHGTPVRMTDWRETLNWMLRVGGY